MEMQQVRYFLAVAKTLNFTRAAEQCNVTQPALTRAIKQLEDELGGELIRREGRLSHLTDLGTRMLPLLTQCYESALNAKAIAAKVRSGDIATLAVGVSVTLDVDVLLMALAELQRAVPGLQLNIRRGNGQQMAEWLKNGDIELAFGGVADQRVLELIHHLKQVGRRDQLTLDGFPHRQRVQQQTLAAVVERQDELAASVGLQALAVTARNGHPTLGVETERRDAPKHAVLDRWATPPLSGPNNPLRPTKGPL